MHGVKRAIGPIFQAASKAIEAAITNGLLAASR
jgi:hypothetical protein